MRLATFNLLHGLSPADGQVVAERLADAVRELDADVLGLQEVDRGQERSHGLDLAAIAAEAMGATAYRFATALIGTPGGGWRPAGESDEGTTPAYGIALASRYPVRSWHVVRLGRAPVRTPIIVPGRRAPTLYKDEPRLGLAAVIDAPLGVMTVATAHLSVTPVFNALQLRRLVGTLSRDLPAPHLLFGDLNLPGSWPQRVTGWQSLARLRTFPAPQPRVQIDHVLSDGALPPVVSVDAPRMELSDHRPLVVTLEAAAAT